MRGLAAVLGVALVFATGIAFGRASGAAERPADPTWSVVGELARSRAYARAAALETGEILVVGGLDTKDERVTIATSEIFDPLTRRSRVLPQQLLGRLNQVLTAAWGGRIVMTGGTEWLDDHWGSVARVDVYLPWSGTWMRGADMLQPRSDHGATALADGRVFVMGGDDNHRLLRTSEIYDPATDKWTAAAPMPRPRTQFSIATLPDGTVLVAGGFQDDGRLTTSTLIYQPWSDRWVTGPDLLDVRLNSSQATLPNGDVLFFGGEKSGAGTAERYAWRERRFTFAGVLGGPRLVAQGAALPDGRVVAVGGLLEDLHRTKFDPTTDAEIWDPAKRVWREIMGAPTKRAYAQLVATDHGLFRISGVGEDEIAYATIEELSWR